MSDRPELPQSNALAEAEPDSLSELFSRDPKQVDRKPMIQALREQRQRWEAVENTGGHKRKSTKITGPANTGVIKL